MMRLKQLFEEKRAVSPVIGVILMVAITVILAAVIGTFVLGLGDQVQQTSPTAQFSFDFDSDAGPDGGNLTVTHDGGDGIESTQLSNSGDIVDGNSQTWEGQHSTVTAGNSVELSLETGSDRSASVIWQASDGDRSSTLAEWEE